MCLHNCVFIHLCISICIYGYPARTTNGTGARSQRGAHEEHWNERETPRTQFRKPQNSTREQQQHAESLRDHKGIDGVHDCPEADCGGAVD